MPLTPTRRSVRIATTVAATALGIFGLLAAPIDSGGALGNSACQWSMTLNDVPQVWDKRHISFFFCLSILLLWGRTRSEFRFFALVVLGYGVLLELSQSVFTRGHCRTWDLIANVIGMGIAFALLATAERICSKRTRDKHASHQ